MIKHHNSFLIYALLSRIKLCRDYALFGGHFWQKFDGRGHENILKDRAYVANQKSRPNAFLTMYDLARYDFYQIDSPSYDSVPTMNGSKYYLCEICMVQINSLPNAINAKYLQSNFVQCTSFLNQILSSPTTCRPTIYGPGVFFA